MKNRLIKMGLVTLAAVISIFAITASVCNINAKADGVQKELLKQNALYKAVYANLEKCYGQMKSPIEESSDNTWASYDSKTYFSDDALKKDYLKFPYDVGNKNVSSCPKMITGWKTNWFINLFTKDGSYDGLLAINKDAKVPEPDWYTASTDKMGSFLKDIGYTLTTSGAENIGNRKCFYLKMNFAQGAIDYAWLPTNKQGNYNVETPDYCVTLGSNNAFDVGEDILVLTGNNDYFSSEYDNGHLTDSSNIVFPFFKDGMEPQWRYHKSVNSDKNYLVAIWSDLSIRYPYTTQYGDDLYATSIYPKVATKKKHFTQDDYQSYCFDLGYVACGVYNGGGLFESDWVFSSIAYANESLSFETLKNRMVTLFASAKTSENRYIFDSVQAVNYTPQKRSYTKGSSTDKYIKYFLKDVTDFNKGVFTDAEKYILYWTYLKDNYNVDTHDSAISNGVLVSWLQDDGTFAQKYIYDPDDSTDKQYVLSSSNKWDGSTQQGWKWIAEQLAAINVEEAFNTDVTSILDPDLDVDPDPDNPDSGTPGTVDTEENCYTKAGSLGWIMCPIIDQLSDAIQNIYDEYITPFLVLDPELFSDSSGTFDAWEQFRDIANIAFIILFIIVIFSQLTGFGIDNYGVKKILPKLIVAAILINLSYIICQLCVDIANIVGAGVGGIFEGIAPLNDPTGIYVDGSGGAAPTLTTTMNVIVILVISVTALALLAIGPSVLIPVLMALLSVFLAILFCFVLLAVRKAFAVVLVAISPLAFVCYMLPNTKPLYKKWFDAFKTVLLAYPICSAMIYGGQMVSRIIINASNNGSSMPFTLAVCAAVIGIVPIFMIPKAIQASVAMVSGGLIGLQNRFGGWAKGKSRDRLNQSRLNDRARYNQQVRQQKMMARTGDYNARRGAEVLADFKARGRTPANMSSSERRRYMAAMGAVNARNQEIESAYASNFYGKNDTDILKELKGAAANGKIDENMLSAGFAAFTDDAAATNAFKELQGTSGFQKVMGDRAARQKVADSLLGRKGSPINQSIGKLIAAGDADKPYQTITDSAIRDKVHGMGADVMKNIDKDVFLADNAASMFSAEQIRAAATAGYTGSTAKNFEKMMEHVDDGIKNDAVKGMTAEQIASLSAGSLAALGAERFAEGNKNAPTEALNMLRSEAGAELRTKMDAQVMKDLNITSEKPVGEGGGSTGGSSSSSESGFPTSPAQLSDDDIRYYNKMKEMSERDGSEVYIDHGQSSSTGTNSATGKPRAAEGNKFDYYPRQKGESNEAYSKRLNRQKLITDKFQSDPPKDGESNADWMKRVGIPKE